MSGPGGAAVPEGVDMSGSNPKAPQWGVTGKQLLRGVRWVIGGYIAVRVGRGLYDQWRRTQEYLTLPSGFFLDLDLERQVLVTRPSSNPLQLLRTGLQQIELRHLISVLGDAKCDTRCRGLLATLGGRENFQGLAQLQELRNALLDFKAHGQARGAATYAYSNTFGEGGMNGTAVYYLASVFDKVYVPPTGLVSLLGFESSQVFVKQLLDRTQVQAEVFRREEYKGALAPLMGDKFDDAQRENLTALLKDLSQQVTEGIASARKLDPATVAVAMAEAPMTAARAKDLGLLDGLMYRDEVEALMTAHVNAAMGTVPGQQHPPSTAAAGGTTGGSSSLPSSPSHATARSSWSSSSSSTSIALSGPRIDLHRYHLAKQWEKMKGAGWWGAQPGAPSTPRKAPGTSRLPFDPEHPPAGLVATAAAAAKAGLAMVVVVHANGPIVQSGSLNPVENPAGDAPKVESHKFVRALRWMRNCPQVKAVVLHVNSPGGSATASDIISRELQLLKEAGKPLVVVMGDVAASGGYYLAAPASKIFAQPGTLTGSIGVIMAKFNIKSALQEWGITSDAVKVGENADWASPFHDLTQEQRTKVDSLVDSTYQDFLRVVAVGRGMDLDQVRAVAKGRVWTGSQALKVGLVDELGGLSQGLRAAQEAAGVDTTPGATIVTEWPSTRLPPIINALKRLNSNPEIDGEPVGATAPTPYPTAATASDNIGTSSSSSPPAVGLAMMATYLAAIGGSTWSDAAAAWAAAAVAPFSDGGSSIVNAISSYILTNNSSSRVPWGYPPIQTGGFGAAVASSGPSYHSEVLSHGSSAGIIPRGDQGGHAAGLHHPQQQHEMQQYMLASQMLLPLLASSSSCSNPQALQQALAQVQQQAVAAAAAPQYMSVDALLLAACC